MNLEQFIAQTHPAIRGMQSRRAHVNAQGFSQLYVRRTTRYFGDEHHLDVLDLATMDALKPGKGAFKRLVKSLTTHYPGLTLYVENVLTPQFQQGLVKMGFLVADEGHGISPCYYLPPREPITVVPRKRGSYGEPPTSGESPRVGPEKEARPPGV